jgi:hypothetical protein
MTLEGAMLLRLEAYEKIKSQMYSVRASIDDAKKNRQYIEWVIANCETKIKESMQIK